jgi:leucyl/phenylalanyl-tRNA--protein transferase
MVYYKNIAILEPGDALPDPRTGPGDEPVAVGFELTPALMLEGYRKGLFAWEADPVTWWSPDPRVILPPDSLHVPRRLARTLRQNPFRVTLDTAFNRVVQECGAPRHRRDSTWITQEFREAFATLFEMGNAHSAECWQGERLVGGIFGVGVNGFFSAESMFHTETDASKIALCHLLQALGDAGVELVDIQMLTPLTKAMGAKGIPRSRYLAWLERVVKASVAPLTPRVLCDEIRPFAMAI